MLNDWGEAVWNIPNVKSNHCEKTVHPCQFPVALAERCVLALTDEDDRVFDPYAGVGSSLIAAVKKNRCAAGSEKESDYVNIARDRIASFLNGTLRLRAMEKPVHEPTGRERVSQIPLEWRGK